jgi:hypothetical protein
MNKTLGFIKIEEDNQNAQWDRWCQKKIKDEETQISTST